MQFRKVPVCTVKKMRQNKIPSLTAVKTFNGI